MYLLIQKAITAAELKPGNLHPTMYLLILLAVSMLLTPHADLHPTMYLLIPMQHCMPGGLCVIYIPLCIY